MNILLLLEYFILESIFLGQLEMIQQLTPNFMFLILGLLTENTSLRSYALSREV